QMRLLAHAQPPVVGQEPALLERLDLAHQHLGIEDGAGTDHADLARVEDARRHEVQDRLLPVHDEGVPGIVAPLETHGDVGVRAEEVDALALPLVPHMGTDPDRRWHQSPSTCADTIGGRVRSSSSTSLGTRSSTWISDSAVPPTFSRPSSIPAM